MHKYLPSATGGGGLPAAHLSQPDLLPPHPLRLLYSAFPTGLPESCIYQKDFFSLHPFLIMHPLPPPHQEPLTPSSLWTLYPSS